MYIAHIQTETYEADEIMVGPNSGPGYSAARRHINRTMAKWNGNCIKPTVGNLVDISRLLIVQELTATIKLFDNIFQTLHTINCSIKVYK